MSIIKYDSEPNKEFGEIDEITSLTKKEFNFLLSNYKSLEYKKIKLKDQQDIIYIPTKCNERNKKDNMKSKEINEDRLTKNILSKLEILLVEKILPKFKQELINEIGPRLDRLEAFHTKDIEEYNKKKNNIY